ncbi:ABC transporter ATP-binding protein [Dongia sp.]|uniref:ABC transporter ATP-binding protein n=1 Tax=Dongia sp. TaxID=1977262 RepID=UPI0037509157
MSDQFLFVDRVAKRFGGLKAVGGDNGLSFAVTKGSFVGLIGPNGAGKSTLFNLISGFLKPTSGRVVLEGRDLSTCPSSEIASLGIGRTFQTPRAFHSLSTLDNVLVGSDNIGENLVSVLNGGWRSADAALKQKALDISARVGLKDRMSASVSKLSGGELRMLEVARQLMRSPRILLLDEPTAGVTPSFQVKLKNLLVDLNKEGVTLVVVEHNLRFLLEIADSVVVLQNGQLLSQGSPAQVRADPKVVAAYLGADNAA